MKIYNYIFSVGLKRDIISLLAKKSREEQKSRNKIIRDVVNTFDYSQIDIKPLGAKRLYPERKKGNEKVAVTVRFRSEDVEMIDFIAEMKNRTRDELINEALEKTIKQ